MTVTKRTRTAAALVASAASLALMSGALGLWSLDSRAALPEFDRGAVTFGAGVLGEPSQMVRSTDGGAVELVLPGSTVAQVLSPVGTNPGPVFWRFSVLGSAMGISGMSYDVSVTSQVHEDGSVHDLSDGVADPGTVLGGSTLRVYPAGGNGDCSGAPAVPEGGEGRNVHLFDHQGRVLQEPGTNASGTERVQDWCAALTWTSGLDGEYVNDVSVVSTADDGSAPGGVDRWSAAVYYPPSLDAVGEYVGSSVVEGTGEDGTTPRARADWSALLVPDASEEPAVTIRVDPVVTTVGATREAGR